MPLTSAWLSRCFDGCLSPGFVLFDGRVFRDDRFGKRHQPLGGVGPAIEEDVFDVPQQIFVDLFVDFDLPGVDDPHVEAGMDRVIQEGRVHRLADRFVAAERKRDVAHAARGLRAGTFALDLLAATSMYSTA